MAIASVFAEAQAAYDANAEKQAALVAARQRASAAIASKQSELDALKDSHDQAIAAAEAEANAARAELTRLQAVLQEFMGPPPDSRVTVKN